MRPIFALVLLISVAWAQNDGLCECGIFVREAIGLPIPHGPIHLYPDNPVDCNSGADEVNCHFNCSLYSRYTINEIDWEEEQEDGTTWGQYMCDASYDDLGWDETSGNCLTTYAEGRYSMTGCPPNEPGPDWKPAIDETKDFCCDQMVNYVPGCPAQ